MLDTLEAPQGLGDIFQAFRHSNGLGVGKALVLAPQNDPLNLDKPANHRLGKWFAELAYGVGRKPRTPKARKAKSTKSRKSTKR